MNTKQALEETKTLPPQESIEIVRGVSLRRTKSGIPVLRVHFTADPERDPKINPEWKQRERRKYTSNSQWLKEQEIVHDAGGGERVFADVLSMYAHKIIISDPAWRPGSTWNCIPGMDHGKVNPTCAEMSYIDHDGCIYICGEYYEINTNVLQNAAALKSLPGFCTAQDVLTDPTMFDKLNQQRDGTFSATAELYYDQGINNLRPFLGNRSDVAFAERLLLHWANLDQREPSVKIVCRMPIPERPLYGVHPYDSPNLLWELMRARREQLSSQQLLTRNASEKLVDRDNHARDAFKGILMTLPEPTAKTREQRIHEAIAPMIADRDFTNAAIRVADLKIQMDEEEQPVELGTRYPFQGGRQNQMVRLGSRFGRRR